MKKLVTFLLLSLMAAGASAQLPLNTAKYGPGVTVLDNVKVRYQFAPSLTMVSPNTGTTINMGPQTSILIIRKASTTATLGIVLPSVSTVSGNAAVIDGALYNVGTVATISALNIISNSGRSVITSPTSLLPLKMLRIVYSKAMDAWYCFQD